MPRTRGFWLPTLLGNKGVMIAKYVTPQVSLRGARNLAAEGVLIVAFIFYFFSPSVMLCKEE